MRPPAIAQMIVAVCRVAESAREDAGRMPAGVAPACGCWRPTGRSAWGLGQARTGLGTMTVRQPLLVTFLPPTTMSTHLVGVEALGL